MPPDKKGTPEEKVVVKSASPADKPVRRSFPGPPEASTLLRVAVARNAYAELIAHAKASLDAEVCGVLAGQICEDSQGVFISVEAAIRGTSANQGSTHVTFTQATWNAIHKALERDHPDLRMVGWYHTHPGFGVEFSDMDLFIQKNFFPGPAQVALVIDPISGTVAICANTPEGPQYLERFWVDGREQPSLKPAPKPSQAVAGGIPAEPGVSGDTMTVIRALESRVGQLVQVIDDQRASFSRFLLGIGMLVCVAVLVGVGYSIRSQFISRNEPPQHVAFLPMPLEVDGKPVLIGFEVVKWQVPPEMNSMMLQEQRQEEADAKAAAALANTNSVLTNDPSEKTSAKETNGSK